MAWLMLLPAGLFFLIWSKVKKTKKKWIPWFVAPIVLLFASACLAASVIGELFAWMAGAVLNWVAGFVPGQFLTGAIIAAVILLALLIVVFFDLIDKVPNKGAVTGLILAPLFALIAVGPIADAVRQGTNQVSEVGGVGFTSTVLGK